VARSGDGILQVPVEIDHNQNNPAAEYDRLIPASTFLPFFGVSPRGSKPVSNADITINPSIYIFSFLLESNSTRN